MNLSGPELPQPRAVLLADCDVYYVQLARMADPEGVGREPLLIVGGTAESRGVVCSASYEVRRFGVRSGMSIAQAIRLCPEATCVPVPRRLTAVKSREIIRVLDRFAPQVESASPDEAYLELTTAMRTVYRDRTLESIAHQVRNAVYDETGIRVSVGGGTSKLIAKLAVERAKPKPDTDATGVHIVAAGAEAEFMRTVTLAEIPFVGPRFQERLAQLGMRTVPDVLRYDPATLTAWLGERAASWLWRRVHGQDESIVEPRLDAKSISRDETFAADIAGDDELARELLALVTRAASDLRDDGLAARTITVKIRDFDFRTRQASRTIERPVIADRVIFGVARTLLEKLRRARRVPARLLGVSLSSLAADAMADQLTLFETREALTVETERDRVLARTVDRVRAKFGDKGILPGGLV